MNDTRDYKTRLEYFKIRMNELIEDFELPNFIKTELNIFLDLIK